MNRANPLWGATFTDAGTRELVHSLREAARADIYTQYEQGHMKAVDASHALDALKDGTLSTQREIEEFMSRVLGVMHEQTNIFEEDH